jgi:hypothetical protein
MTWQVPKHLEEQLKMLSRERGKTEEELLEGLVEEGLQDAITTEPHRRQWIGMASSGVGNLSQRVDELLFAEGLPGREQ